MLASHLSIDYKSWIMSVANEHACSNHPLFARLKDQTRPISREQAGLVLKNYDAHASHLRRLLLKACTLMPEKAVGFILENVRNEYGNGNVDGRHQLQLQDLAHQSGTSAGQYARLPVKAGVKRFIREVTPFYYPPQNKHLNAPFRSKAGIAAGAITATEILAIEEFKALQIAFTPFGLADHIWFDHVTVECEHTDESICLALYFAERGHKDSVKWGLEGVLKANLSLYDGLLACLS